MNFRRVAGSSHLIKMCKQTRRYVGHRVFQIECQRPVHYSTARGAIETVVPIDVKRVRQHAGFNLNRLEKERKWDCVDVCRSDDVKQRHVRNATCQGEKTHLPADSVRGSVSSIRRSAVPRVTESRPSGLASSNRGVKSEAGTLRAACPASHIFFSRERPVMVVCLGNVRPWELAIA